jgi:hypothetical protein
MQSGVMRKVCLYIICIAGFIGLSANSFAQTKPTYKKLDLYFYGKAIILDDRFYLNNIGKRGSDLYFLGTAQLGKSDTLLTGIKNKDFYYLGLGILRKDTAFFNTIIDKDWYYYGWAMIKKDEKYLKKAINIDIYNLGIAILREDLNFLEELND